VVVVAILENLPPKSAITLQVLSDLCYEPAEADAGVDIGPFIDPRGDVLILADDLSRRSATLRKGRCR